MEFTDRYGPWAVVAGASLGTGLALSHEVAARGLNVVMIGRDLLRLDDAAREVREEHGGQVRTVAVDLGAPDLADVATGAVAGLDVGLFVYNASLQVFGRFIESSLDDHVRSVAVNCTAPIVLSHLLASPMIERGRGGIAIVSSLSATQGSLRFSTYAAGKAFGWILAESLWAELGEQGIDVCTLLSGPIASPGFLDYQQTLDRDLCARPDSSGLLDRARARLLAPSTPHEVAVAMLDGLGQGPVCYAHPLDEEVAAYCLSASREEVIQFKRAYHETQKRSAPRVLAAPDN